MKRIDSLKQHHRLAIGILAAALVLSVLPRAAAAIDERLAHQLNVMEKVIDEVLVDSPNILVFGSEPTHAFYIDEFGAILSFEASLTGAGGWNPALGLEFLNRMHVETEDGKTTIWFDENPDSLKADANSARDQALKQYVESMKGRGEAGEEGKSEADRYAEGKQELIDGLLDYGATLTALRDDQWIAITAYLRDAGIFEEREISHLILKVRVSDLRAFGDGRLSRDALNTRIAIEEY